MATDVPSSADEPSCSADEVPTVISRGAEDATLPEKPQGLTEPGTTSGAGGDDGVSALEADPSCARTDLGIPVRIELEPAETDASDGRYAILGELGRGGMGVVYRAFDRDLRRHVAMKVLSERLAHSADCLSRFVEEAQATGQLEHPGIVPVHEIGRDPQGRLFFTMKLVRGRTLSAVVRDLREGDPETAARFSPFRLLQIFADVCRTVHYAHVRGVIHRDLKPSNVMIGKHGDVQVMDWGLVKLIERAERVLPRLYGSSQEIALAADRPETRFGSLLGTPAYMAPEQADATGDGPDARSDVYALGAILFHLLTGRPPFAGNTTRETVTALLTQPPPRPRSLEPTVPRELEAICLRALRKDPEHRYASAEALADDIQAYLEGRPVLALPIGRVERLRKFCRREPVKAGLFGLLLLALLGMVVALGLMLREAQAKELEAQRRREAYADLAREKDAKDLAYAALEVEYRQLADVGLIEVFEARLGPAAVSDVERFRWLADFQPLSDRVVSHRAALEEVEAELAAASSDTLALRQKADSLAELLQDLEYLQGDAARLRNPPGDSALVARRWREALPAIAAEYGGLELAPCTDLIPIGRDPHSGLWEFAHRWSGPIPERDSSGVLGFEDSSGVVFVLVPAGSFAMGHADGDPDSQPVHTVHLSAFLLAKHEVTQAQWEHMAGYQPSWYTNERHNVRRFSVRQPVDNVSWLNALWLAERYGLTLPTEAQWEYAARAGTEDAFWLGNDLQVVLRGANVDGPVDGHDYMSPVGTYRANPWGLYDTIGNVWEWCMDSYPSPYPEGPRFDPLVYDPAAEHRVVRGGSWAIPAEYCGSWRRLWEGVGANSGDIGLRLARRLPLP